MEVISQGWFALDIWEPLERDVTKAGERGQKKKDERMLKTVEDLGKASRMNFEILFNARGQLVD